MDMKDTDMKEKLEDEEILGVHDPEEPLKSERVEEALRAMPDWEVTLEGQAITRVKELPSPEVASLYTAYVTGFAGSIGLPVAMSVSDGLVLVTLYARGTGGRMGSLTESVLGLAREIG
jgi:pterin-4a-carbinolamine dehydratase